MSDEPIAETIISIIERFKNDDVRIKRLELDETVIETMLDELGIEVSEPGSMFDRSWIGIPFSELENKSGGGTIRVVTQDGYSRYFNVNEAVDA